ncbi:hypothetical protein HRI_004230700 [Hibiscus trionum]|uniref:non-specific serine/threonine protein kinase n=1 Tax=Hibiscus trionum TaxID=183268 RepID=A0A9W7IZY1_HIBTR|nr:hypothetical protein HRI_004230700 [Hibiscus trionum]
MTPSPHGSPPSPPPPENKPEPPPPASASPPPKPPSPPPKPPSPPPPEESNTPSPPSPSSPPSPPSSSSSTPSSSSFSSSTETPPSSTSTSSTPTTSSSPPSPPTPSSSSTSTSTSTSTPKSPSSSSTTKQSPSPSPKTSSNTYDINQNNDTTTSSTTPSPLSSPPTSSSSSSAPIPSLPPLTNLTFGNGLPSSSAPKLSPPPPNSNSSTPQINRSTPKSSDAPFSSTLPIIIGVPIAVGLLLALILVFINVMRDKLKKRFDNQKQKGGAGNGKGHHQANDDVAIDLPSENVSDEGQTPSPQRLNKCYFTYEELAIATQGFSEKNLLGQGGFGFVHKGVLPDGKEVAVKSLKSGSGQGQREFQAEVEIISRVHHRHLVSLVGYSIAGDKKMLVYEFVPNKTLEFHLHNKGLPTMDWSTRLKIAVGAAKGLSYLHEDCHPRIIHRDIKSANILLDFCFEPMVADFGMAKLTQDSISHISTRVMGTFGYLAPEYVQSGKLTDKSDVFSFGVVLLELITGRRPVDPTSNMNESLVDWARPLCARAMENGNFSQLVDPRLGNNFVHHEMAAMVSCAAACIRLSAGRRPKMRQIVRALEDGVPLEELGETPRQHSSSSNSKSDDYESSSNSADINDFSQ